MEKDQEKNKLSTKRLQELVKKRDVPVVVFEQNSIRRYGSKRKGFSSDSYSFLESDE